MAWDNVVVGCVMSVTFCFGLYDACMYMFSDSGYRGLMKV